MLRIVKSTSQVVEVIADRFVFYSFRTKISINFDLFVF